MNRYIYLNDENIVTSIRFGQSIVDGEIESDIGELGQIMQSDGTFITPEPEPVEPTPSIEEQILIENQYQTALIEMNMMGGI